MILRPIFLIFLKKHPITRIFTSILVLFCVYSCSSPNEDSHVITPDEPIPIEKEEIIRPDTSLLQASVREWNDAPKDERLSNCAGMILSSIDTIQVQTNLEINQLTRELCDCMEDLTYGMPTMNNDKASRVAKRCLHSIKYREEIDTVLIN